jgi:hypothetical protein
VLVASGALQALVAHMVECVRRKPCEEDTLFPAGAAALIRRLTILLRHHQELAPTTLQVFVSGFEKHLDYIEGELVAVQQESGAKGKDNVDTMPSSALNKRTQVCVCECVYSHVVCTNVVYVYVRVCVCVCVYVRMNVYARTCHLLNSAMW